MADDSDWFIDAEFLNRLQKLKIATKKGLKGPQRGEHRSWQSGEGYEFLDYRKYHLGDDLRYVDWSVYGRLDKLFVKLFHAEENQTIHILLDMSRSMGCGHPSKDIVAKKMAAAVSYICLSRLDKIGLLAFSDRILETRSPARGQKKYPEVLNFLRPLRPAGQTHVNGCLSEFASICKRPGIAVIVSDFFDPQGYQDGLKAMVYRNFDVNLIQVLDHEELFGSKTGNFALKDVETGERKVTFVNQSLLDAYRTAAKDFISNLKSCCRRYGITYALYDTQIPFEAFLTDYLTHSSIFR